MAVNPNETAYQQKPTAVNPNAQTRQKPTAAEPVAVQAAWANAQQNQTPPAQTAAPQQNAKETTQAGAKAVGSMLRGFVNNMAQNPQVVSAQTQSNAQTTQEAMGGVYKVGDNGQAPKGLKVGDQVVTGGGTYTIKSVNPDGTYQSQLTNPNQTTGNYGGQYANAPVAPSNVYRVGADGKAPTGLKVGDQVVTGGGTYQITGVNADGTYQSQLVNRNQTTANYTGAYANAQGTAPASTPAATPAQPQQPSFAKAYQDGIDYGVEIQKAVAAGNLQAAAVLESLRNQKIDAEGLGNQYAKTNLYAQYLEGVDPAYAAQLRGGYVETDRIQTPNPYPGMEELTKQLYDAAGQQIQADIDYNVEQGVNELNRALEDAQPEFQKQRNQVDIDAARAMSNSALYAEARGDRGGIGQSQYNEIQAAAMQNRQAINTAQTKLATDTARQIADLRAQGKHDAATALLQNTQKYLAQLMSLRQAGAEWALNVEQMQNTIDQQLRNHALQVANITGVYDGKPTYAAQKNEQAAAQELLMNYLKYGGMPSDALLNAAGYSAFAGDVSGLANLIAAANFSSGGSGGGGSSGSRSSGGGSGSGSGNSGTPTYQEPVGPDDNTIEYGKGDVKGRTSVAAPKQYGGSSSAGKMTSLSYSPDEGIFTWNGKSYNHVNALIKDINAAGLTADQEAVLLAKLRSWGFKK